MSLRPKGLSDAAYRAALARNVASSSAVETGTGSATCVAEPVGRSVPRGFRRLPSVPPQGRDDRSDGLPLRRVRGQIHVARGGQDVYGAGAVMEEGVTNDERVVFNLLARVWNAYLILPGRERDDNDDFRRAVHTAQRIVAMRVAGRCGQDRGIGAVLRVPVPPS